MLLDKNRGLFVLIQNFEMHLVLNDIAVAKFAPGRFWDRPPKAKPPKICLVKVYLCEEDHDFHIYCWNSALNRVSIRQSESISTFN